jgi:hypothetical protein
VSLDGESLAEIRTKQAIEARGAGASLHLYRAIEVLASQVRLPADEVHHADISERQCLPTLDAHFAREREHSFEVAQSSIPIARGEIRAAERGKDFDREYLEPGGFVEL